MDQILRPLCMVSLAAALAQARAMERYYQRDASGDSDLSIYVTVDKILGTSPLLTPSDIHRRAPVDVVLTNATTIAATDTLIIAADATTPLHDWVARKITASSDANSSTLVYGTDFDGEAWEGYTYQTISTGLSCDTTASCETVRAAVGECADRLHEARAVRGCCRFSYGGTWSAAAQADG